VEHLDAMVLAIGDVYPALRIAADVVRDVELAGIGTGFAPGKQQLAIRRVLVDTRVAVPVSDVDITARRQSGMRAAMKRFSAHVRRRFAGDTNLQKNPAVERALAHGVIAVVGAVERLVRADVDAVRIPEYALAP